VAILTLDLLDAAVHIVAEGDRLFRAETAHRRNPEKIHESGHTQQGDQRQENRYSIFSHRLIPCQKAD
jgi:hypothetical protein